MGKFDKVDTTAMKEILEKGGVLKIDVRMIKDEHLIDYEGNIEIGDVSDIEKSIDEVGFTSILEVTDYGIPKGKYRIISGHRRRAAGRNKGIKTFECKVFKFSSELEVENHVLLANSQRDSDNAPFFKADLAAKHLEYLNKIEFKGNKNNEIAKRLNVKVSTVEKYLAASKAIQPIKDIVNSGFIALSSASLIGVLPHDEQDKANIILTSQATSGDGKISRAAVEDIVRSIRKGDGYSPHKTVTVTDLKHGFNSHSSDEKSTFPILTEPSNIVTNSYRNGKTGIFNDTGEVENTRGKQSDDTIYSAYDSNNHTDCAHYVTDDLDVDDNDIYRGMSKEELMQDVESATVIHNSNGNGNSSGNGNGSEHRSGERIARLIRDLAKEWKKPVKLLDGVPLPLYEDVNDINAFKEYAKYVKFSIVDIVNSIDEE